MRHPEFPLSAVAAAVMLTCAFGAQAQTQADPEQAQSGPAGNDTVLQAVTVNASADASQAGLPAEAPGGQVARGSRLGMLGNVDAMDAPFSATAYTRQLIQDQQARGIGDVLLNDPVIHVARGFGNYQELYLVRGFPVASDDIAYNGLYGLLPRQFVATELIERVEVLRGANSFINGVTPGGGAVGGAINLVPKRAANEALTQATLGIDNGGQVSLGADISRRFGPDQASGVRVNLARRAGDTVIDDEERELSVFAVGLDHRARNFRLSADLGYQEHKLDQARPSVTPPFAGGELAGAPDASSNFAQPWSFSDERDLFGTLRGEFDLNDNLTAWAAAGVRRGKEANSLANPTLLNAAGDTSTYRFDNVRRDNVRTAEAGIRAKLRTGAVGHTLVAAASVFDSKSRNAYALSDFAGFASNLYNPVVVPAPLADAVVGGSLSDPLLTSRTQLSSFALSDTLSFMEDRVLLTIGARHQNIKDKAYNYTTGARESSYDESSVTPVAGVVFKPQPSLALYANYAEGLARGATAPANASNAGENFSPYRSRQKEIGAKYDGGSYGLGLALFTTAQPAGLLESVGGPYSISGEQRHRGAELSWFGMPLRGLRVLGGLTWLDAEQRDTGTGNDGKRVIGAPKFRANAGVEWDVPGVRGLALTGRALYTGSQYADAANNLKLPSWTRLDAGVRYVTAYGKQLITLRANLENLTNRDYWASAGGYPGQGYLVLGNPRTLMLSASLDF